MHGAHNLASNIRPPGEQASEVEIMAWNQRIEDRLVALLLAMSKALGYDFSAEQLRRGLYYPKGRIEMEQSQLAVLHGLRTLLEGRSALPMKVAEAPSSPELIETQIATLKKSANAYEEDGALKVRMVERQPRQNFSCCCASHTLGLLGWRSAV